MLPAWVIPLLPGAQTEGSRLAQLLAFTSEQPILWTSIALTIAICSGLVLFRAHVENPRMTISRGAESAAHPLLNTAAVIGFGGVVSQTALFSSFGDLMLNSGLHPLVSAVISVNVLSAVAGSATGALGVWLPAFGQQYLDAGIPPETLHRVLIVGSGVFDALPHCGGIITCLTIMGLSHREAYKDSAVLAIGIPMVATIALIGVVIFLQ